MAVDEEVSFPADDDEGDVDNPAISWKELPQHRWYLVEGKRDVKTNWGWTKLLNLKHADGERFAVWATGLISATINDKWGKKANSKLFIKSLGGRKSTSSPYTYYDYKYKTI